MRSIAPLLPCVLVCFLVLGGAPKASAQIPEINITAITDFLNEFFAALQKDVQSSFPGTKLYVLKGKAENTGDYNDVDDDDDDDDGDDEKEGKLEITKYTYNNITSFKFETQSGNKIKSVTIRKGLPTTFGKVVLVVPGTPAKDDEEYTMTSWIVNASYVAAYNGMSVTVFNQWVAGQVPERARPWLAASNLVGLSKPNGDVRPVKIGEVLPRILARALCISLRPAMVSYFLPCNQLGAGTRVGAEILTHSFRLALATHPDCDLYLRACPFVHSLESARGSRQGDPLSPFLFAFTQQQVMEPIIREFKDLLFLSYADDTYILGPAVRILEAFGVLRERLEWVGLEVHAHKCRFWEREGKGVERALQLGMQRVDEGLTVVGVPIGKEVWEVVRLRERLRQLQAPLPWLPLLDHPQTASHLLAIAVSARPMYLARTMPPRPETH
ncbi:unnamed protein product [Closterium sp. NIES-64]|nr:unnamed protein product [Closterium sp. NIES-64]